MFEKAFNQCDPNLDWTVIDICGGNHDVDVQDFDGFIISGSRSSVNDPKLWIEELLNLIRRIIEREVPLVGLCFGHQAIAKSLGGLVSKSKTGWNIGCVPVELTAAGKKYIKRCAAFLSLCFSSGQCRDLAGKCPLNWFDGNM